MPLLSIISRLYTRDNYEQDMEAFEPGEMVRVPLDSVILMMKGIMNDGTVTETLLDCLEPPDISAIDRSFESLYQSQFITVPADDCDITSLGSFVSQLGIDLALGSLIGLGIQFGVAAETIQMAAVLSFPKTPWILSNPLVHKPKEFNAMTKKTFVSQCHFDSHLYSEPLATMNMLYEYEQIKGNSNNWCWKNGIQAARVRRLSGTCANLRKR
jgi:HrpA-like RNA helicase